jgi:hypothetical protein
MVGAAGCQSQETGFHVVVDGTVQPVSHFNHLRVEVKRKSTNELLVTEDVKSSELHPLPYTFNFLGGKSTPAGTELLVTAYALLDTTEVSRDVAGTTLGATPGMVTLQLRVPGTGEPTPGTGDGGLPDGGGMTPGRAINGTACADGAQCISGFCVDGLCCNSACGGACDSCSGPTPGTCATLAKGATGAPSCAPFLCPGDGPACGIRCDGDGDCAAGASCVANVCVGKKLPGTQCGAGGECASGFCTNGVCCNAACDGACDACNVAGQVGTCRPLATGMDGSPSCGAFVCNGTDNFCPVTCTVDANCRNGATCAPNGQCALSPNLLSDTFDDNLLDPSKWVRFPGAASGIANAIERNGRLEIPITPPPAGSMVTSGFAGVVSRDFYDFRNGSVTVTPVAPGGPAGNIQAAIVLRTPRAGQGPEDPIDNRVYFLIENGQILFMQRVNNTYVTRNNVTFDPVLMNRLRLRISGGNLFYETLSPQGQPLTHITVAIPFSFHGVRIELQGGATAVGGGATSVIWDTVGGGTGAP